jgi:hypothetical protein
MSASQKTHASIRQGGPGAAHENAKARRPRAKLRESEFVVSRGGLHQESDHNKHNRSGQGRHKPQHHAPARQKH